MKYDFLILSSLPKNSGCFLRAKYLASALENCGQKVKLVIPYAFSSFFLSFSLNFFKYLFCCLTVNYRYGLCIKPYPNALIPLLLKKLLIRCKVITDIDDIDFGYRKGMVSTLSRCMQKPLPRFCDLITYHNPLLKKFIQQEYGITEKKLYPLLQGVDFQIFDHSLKKSRFRKSFFIKHRIQAQTRLLVYTAHLNIASDLDILLPAIKPLLDEKAFLIIAGGGPLLKYFQSLAARLQIKNIFFTGYITSEMIVQYVLAADYTLVYYQDKKVNYYRSSMKLREYLALKKKVIANDVGELKQFRNYTYQSKGSIDNYINLIRKLLLHPPQDNRTGQAYQFLLKNYNWQVIAEKFLSAVEQRFII